MSAGGAVAAMRGRIIRAFVNAGAFSEAEAKSLDQLGLYSYAHGMFRRMEESGVILQTNNGRYYLDREYYEAREKRKKIIIPIAIALLIVVLFLCIR